MSIVGHLYHGELGDWCEERLTGSHAVVREIAHQIASTGVTRPDGRVHKQHWPQSDRTFATRFALMVQPAPPYSALLGLVSAGLVSRSWADGQAARYPTHASLSAPELERALDLRPVPGGWIDLRCAYEKGAPEWGVLSGGELDQRLFDRPGFPDEPVLGELFGRIRSYFIAHARSGQLSQPGEEIGLSRLCWLLAAFKHVYRNDSIEHSLYRLFQQDPLTVEALHAIADDDAIADPLALVSRLRSCGALEQIRRLAGHPAPGMPWGIAAPVIFDHSDENTFIINGPQGATLLEISAAITVAKKQNRTHRRFWKLISDAWLDTDDTYRIRTAGFYFAPYGFLVTWPLSTLAGILTEGDDPRQAREEFIRLASKLRAEDYARRLAWRAANTP